MPIGTLTTLGEARAIIRTQSNSLSQQESGIIDPQLDDIINQSIMFVRSLLGRALDAFYTRKVTLSAGPTITSGAGTASLASYPMTDPMRTSLFDPVLLEIPVLEPARFNALRSLYPITGLAATEAFATLYQNAASSNVYTLELHTGAGNGAINTIQMTYLAIPTETTATATVLDCPDHVIPIVLDAATVQVFRRLAKQPPAEIENRLIQSVGGYMQQLGLQVTAAQPSQVRP